MRGAWRRNRLTASPMISKLRSTSWRVRRSRSNSAKVMPAVSSTMYCAASRMSSRTPSVSGGIEHLPGLIDGLDEALLAQRARHDEVDGATEQLFQSLLEL